MYSPHPQAKCRRDYCGRSGRTKRRRIKQSRIRLSSSHAARDLPPPPAPSLAPLTPGLSRPTFRAGGSREISVTSSSSTWVHLSGDPTRYVPPSHPARGRKLQGCEDLLEGESRSCKFTSRVCKGRTCWGGEIILQMCRWEEAKTPEPRFMHQYNTRILFSLSLTTYIGVPSKSWRTSSHRQAGAEEPAVCCLPIATQQSDIVVE